MNFVGKILVFLIFLASTVFMAGTFMVFATQQNWRQAVVEPNNGLNAQVSRLQAEIQELNRQKTEMEAAHNRSIAEARTQIASSETRVGELQKAYDDQQAQVAKYEEDSRKATDQVKVLAERMIQYDAELAQVRQQQNETRKERDDALAQVTTLTDQIAQATRAAETLEQRNAQLAVELNQHRQVLAANNLQLDSNVKVEGVITAVNESNFVEISIGSDDGLQVGKVLDVYRYAETVGEPKWLGKVEVIKTDSDKAVAQVMAQFTQGARIQVGDRVATLTNPAP